ncbi:RNA polymerase sigma-70 factor [Oceanicola granulosus HTCC2516]|uniref:Regulator of SigK n=1 Tax=Oceanicola granulosus (strain ATCC BAA-861 / DSM 15982 / KCTC 12143 / HTCC2516) TaxID=314256 RepID=Q2CIG3_OCEGH|nr:anti-sigma factor [Oceanicola granulosus]EAR52626.1 RNA polymerase sigma-70 factor [Oceanicola granulosus HTCC2516]
MSDQGEDHDDRLGLAAEYVLGLLDPEERRDCDRLLADDPAFRAAVATWSEHFAAIADAEVEPVAPPAGLFGQIERRLFAEERQSGWLRRLGILPAILGAAAAALLLLVVTQLGLLQPGPQGPLTPVFQAEMTSETDDLVVIAALDPEAGIIALNRLEGGPRAGRALELWLAPTGDATPISLGVLPDDRVVQMPMPVDELGEGAYFALSDEPPGGSPTGAPTGDVVAVGEVRPL